MEWKWREGEGGDPLARPTPLARPSRSLPRPRGLCEALAVPVNGGDVEFLLRLLLKLNIVGNNINGNITITFQ